EIRAAPFHLSRLRPARVALVSKSDAGLDAGKDLAQSELARRAPLRRPDHFPGAPPVPRGPGVLSFAVRARGDPDDRWPGPMDYDQRRQRRGEQGRASRRAALSALVRPALLRAHL